MGVLDRNEFTVIAGPCAVESEEQIFQAAAAIAAQGVGILRGGCFKPRTSPYAFQGMGVVGLRLLREAAKAHGLRSITEVMDVETLDLIASQVDILQIGSRNMQNFSLLRAVGRTQKPVLLKRSFSATYRDLLDAAEYIVAGGNEQIILCERGIRTFEPFTRNTLDISAVPVLKELCRFPVIVDPSHASGLTRLVTPLTLAALAVGADGAMIEVHPCPEGALCDKEQALSFGQFGELMDSLRLMAPTVGRAMPLGSLLAR